MYDNPPSSPWLTPQRSPPPPPRDSALYQPPSTLTLPNLRPTQHPTLESLLEWQTRLGLRCCTSFVSPETLHPDSLFSSNPTTGSSHYDPPLAEGIYCVASEAGGYECTSTTAAMGHVLKPLSSQTPQTPQDSIVTTPTALITKSINQTVLAQLLTTTPIMTSTPVRAPSPHLLDPSPPPISSTLLSTEQRLHSLCLPLPLQLT